MAPEFTDESAFQATRHGLDANLLDRDGVPVPARDLARRCIDLAADAASKFGRERELARIERMLEQGSGADIQRRVCAERGVDGLLEYLVAETARLD